MINTIPLDVDPRFSVLLHRPARLAPECRVLVALHGIGREAKELCQSLQPLADRLGYVVACPLFLDLGSDGDANEGYMFLNEPGVDYLRLMDAVVAAAWQLAGGPPGAIDLLGFSAGAQAAHRYLFLNPERVRTAYIVSPGAITLPTSGATWWNGMADVAERFGVTFNADAVRRVVFHLLVGEMDLGTPALSYKPGQCIERLIAMQTGTTRIERLQSLHEALLQLGAQSRLSIVKGAGHNFRQLIPAIEAEFDVNRAVNLIC